MNKKWLPFYICLGIVLLLSLLVLMTLELIPLPAAIAPPFLALRAALTNFELALIKFFAG